MEAFFLLFASYHKRLEPFVLRKSVKTQEFYAFAAVCTLFFGPYPSHIIKLQAIVAREISFYSMAFDSWAFPACLMVL